MWTGALVGLLATGAGSFTACVAIAVNELGKLDRLPWGLHLIADYPAPSLLVLILSASVFGVLFWVVEQHRRSHGPRDLPSPPDSFELSAGWSSASSVGDGDRPGGVSAGVVEAPVGELPEVRGRTDEVGWLLSEPSADSGGLRVVAGLGGCGKTTVALAAAEVALARGWRVWWVSAVDLKSLVEGMSAVALQAGASAEEVSGA